MLKFKYQIKKFSNSFGIDLYPLDKRNSIQNYLDFLFKKYEIKDVVDIGANKGQYHNMLRNIGYKGNVFLIEPLDLEWNYLKKNIVTNNSILLEKMAIGEKNEYKILYNTQNSVSSSLKKRLNKDDIISQTKVKVNTLDEVIKTIQKDNVFVKIDSQGYEYEIVSSINESLKNIKIIQAELAINVSYENEKDFIENIKMFESKGFKPIFIFPGITNKEGFLSEIEVIFINSKI